LVQFLIITGQKHTTAAKHRKLRQSRISEWC